MLLDMDYVCGLERLKYDLQHKALEKLVNVFVIYPTGSGKSLIYQSTNG